jgi:hypothetical protein
VKHVEGHGLQPVGTPLGLLSLLCFLGLTL